MITINCSILNPIECSFDVTESQLDVMVGAGVDVCDEYEVADFYRKNLGKEIDGVYFLDLFRIADHEHTGHKPEIEEWYPEGEAPERYWPAED